MADFVLDIDFGAPVTIAGIVLKAVEGTQWLTVIYQGFTLTMRGSKVVYTLPVDHKVGMKVTYTDAHGNPAVVDGPVVWTSSDATRLTVTVDASDSSICEVVPVGPTGQVQVTATADADLGSGVRHLITTADISVVAGEAVTGVIEPTGAPVPIA